MNGIATAPRRRHNNRIKQGLSYKILFSIAFVIFCIYALFFLYIFFWLMMTCLKTHREIALNPFSLPVKLHWGNFVDMFEAFSYNDTSMLGMIWNSTWHSVGTTIVFLWVNASTAYITQKYRFFGSRFLPAMLMFLMVFPLYGTGGAAYRLIFKMGFANSYLIILTAGTIGTWNFFYFQSFFSNLSWNYAEAAFIDGANDWQVFYRIMLPQSIGIIGAIGITFWTTAWTDYGSQILYLTEMPTLSVGIYYFQQQMVYKSRMDVLYCACLVSLVPVFALYALFNNVLFKNISLGGIKM